MNFGENIKSKIPSIPTTALLMIIIITVAFSAFSIGWISRGQADNTTIPKQQITLPSGSGEKMSHYVSSQNSDIFHYRWCSGAQRIDPENKVYYQSYEKAVASGLKPAGNCPGLQARQK
jgi:hypothetical protein